MKKRHELIAKAVLFGFSIAILTITHNMAEEAGLIELLRLRLISIIG